jgi:hypothetical protein
MALMLAICRPQPNWMPRKPKLIFQICQKLRSGLRKYVPAPVPETIRLWLAADATASTAGASAGSVFDVVMAALSGAASIPSGALQAPSFMQKRPGGSSRPFIRRAQPGLPVPQLQARDQAIDIGVMASAHRYLLPVG